MAATLFTWASGWVLVVLIGTTVALPYVFRRGASAASGAKPRPFLERMRPHVWLGDAVVGLTVAHLWPAMSQGWARRVDALGLYLATGALLLAVAQVALGLGLRAAAGRRRRRLRRAHFWTMVALVALAAGHVARNSAALRVLLG
jgi:hypothetical protein